MAHCAHIRGNIVQGVYNFPDKWEAQSQHYLEEQAVLFISAVPKFDWQPGDYMRQTSYNATIRKNYAAIGWVWDEGRNAFYLAQPYPSWTLDESTCKWVSPVPYPSDGKLYTWNEAQKTWTEI